MIKVEGARGGGGVRPRKSSCLPYPTISFLPRSLSPAQWRWCLGDQPRRGDSRRWNLLVKYLAMPCSGDAEGARQWVERTPA